MEQSITRKGDRRQSRRLYWGLDRRSGFDRRANPSLGNRILLTVRDNPVVLLALLGALNIMNLLDFVFTVDVLEAGHAEGNPLMALLFAHGYVIAGVTKVAIIALVSTGIWYLRRYRRVLQVEIFACFVFTAVLLYHGYGKLFVY